MARKNADLERLDREEQVRKQKMIIGGAAGGLLLLILLIVLIVRSSKVEPVPETVSSAPEAVDITPSAEQLEPTIAFPNHPEYTETVTILGTGDNLIHESLYKDAETDEGFDFTPMYEHVKEYIQAADIATINQETPIAARIAPISGYPKFNSPDEAGDALVDAGFDVINQGNNHIMDMGTDGIYATLDYWNEKGIPCVGVYTGLEDMYTRRIIEVNGIKVAFLSFVEMTNFELPESSSIEIAFFFDKPLVEDLIRDAKNNADVVVVHAHWGTENVDAITSVMEEMSQQMVDWGADVIFGNHTHLLQKLTILTRESDGALCPVLYSGGNFLSGQQLREQLISGLMTVTFAKNPDTGEIETRGVTFKPTITHYTGDRHDVTIYPVSEYTEEMALENGVMYEDFQLTREFIDDWVDDHIPDQFLIP